MSEKPDPDMEAAKKRDAYEVAEGLPQKFHAWALVNKRIQDAAKRAKPENQARFYNFPGESLEP